MNSQVVSQEQVALLVGEGPDTVAVQMLPWSTLTKADGIELKKAHRYELQFSDFNLDFDT